MKKKIVIIVEAMLGGVRQHVCDIVENLEQEKYEIYIIYSDLRADGTFYKKQAKLEKYAKLIRCNEMQRSLGKKDYEVYKKIVRIINKINPDIVHCHSSKAGVVGRMAAKKCGIPLIIYTPHAYAFQTPDISWTKRMLYVYAEKLLSRYATTVTINVSKGEMKAAQDYHIDAPDKFTLIYNGICQIDLKEKKLLKQSLGLDEYIYYIGVTARCTGQKEPFTFLEIARKIIQEVPNIDFIYIGDGEMRDVMKRWIVKNGLQQKIHMPGFRTDAPEIVGALDLYLSTASYEGLPYSILEAMRAGVPVLATDIVGNNELVFEGVNGKLFPVGDVNRACELIMEQYKKCNISEEDVRDTFQKKFSLNVMMEQLDKVYAGQRGNT